MENKIKRPISVWIAQILLFVCVIACIIQLLAGIALLVREVTWIFLLPTAISTLFLVFLVTASWGMATRRFSGRWLGIGTLSLILIYSIVIGCLVDISDSNDAASIDSPEIVGYIVAQVILTVISFIAILHLSFSYKVAAFFSQK